MSLAGAKWAKDAVGDQTEREGDREEEASRAGHVGRGGYKKPSFDDE